MSSFLDEFKKFILRGNVVDLAVGIVIGAAFGKIVDSLVKDLFLPVIGLITGGFDISTQVWNPYGDVRIGWGNSLQSVINFVIIGFCLFLVVKGMNALNKRVALETPAAPPEPSSTDRLLIEIRDTLRSGPLTPPRPLSS